MGAGGSCEPPLKGTKSMNRSPVRSPTGKPAASKR